MTNITIPPEAVEAAARAAYAEWVSLCVTSGGVEDEYRSWDGLDDEERNEWHTHATAALRAGIAAWPGMKYTGPTGGGLSQEPLQAPLIILPLPQETRDE